MTEKIQLPRDWHGGVISLGTFQSAVLGGLAQLRDEDIITRIWNKDYSVWKPDPDEISNRLGWLNCPSGMNEFLPGINAFAKEIQTAGYTRAVLLGMGGSSLAPEVFRNTFGVGKGFPDLTVLDSTDPGAVLQQARDLDLSKTLFIVSTKSGGTVETMSFMKYFYELVALEPNLAVNAGEHFVAITDPGSGLEKIAQDLKFRRTFLNDPNIGGRYSALSNFGLVPAALIGIDIETVLQRAELMASSCRSGIIEKNPGAQLGTIMGRLALNSVDKLTLLISPLLAGLGAWIEQLVAESTGKEGKGILPVDGEDLNHPGSYSKDRYFIYIRLRDDTAYDRGVNDLKDAGFPVVILDIEDPHDLGAEFFRWEMATAIASYFLGINPFDQPDVESAKVLARQMMAAYQEKGELHRSVPTLEAEGIRAFSDISASGIDELLSQFLGGLERESIGQYVAIQAFLMPTPEANVALQALRSRIQTRYSVATTVGYGPRFLHSTGQLHKGDAGKGLFIQLIGEVTGEAAIPDQQSGSSGITFGVLKRAQALGDRQALLNANRKVLAFDLGTDMISGIRRLSGAIG